MCFSASTIAAESPVVVVCYPDLNDYNAIFESIAAGVQMQTTGTVQRIALPDDYSVARLRKRLTSGRVTGVVALGRRGIEAVRRAHWTGPSVISAVLWDASLKTLDLPGVVLNPDPHKVLEHLKQLAPKIHRVHAVIDREQGGPLADRSRAAAADLGLTLIVREVATRRAAALAYRDILKTIDPEHDALWLPIDPTFDETMLRLVLTQAWNRRLVVFSSAPDHAQRGALFSFYPDYRAIGERLAEMLRAQLPPDPVQTPLRLTSDIRLAVNLRTARHLGFDYPRDVEATFAVVFQ